VSDELNFNGFLFAVREGFAVLSDAYLFSRSAKRRKAVLVP